MLSLQQLSDRIEIQDLITDYSYAVDTHSWAELDAIFTPDAALDFTATGGLAGTLPEIKVWFEQVLNLFSSHQHLVATSKIVLAGDTATARTICHNPMTLTNRNAQGGPDIETVIFVGLWYDDTFVRTPQGWRISSRSQRKSYLHGLPQR